MFNLEKALKTLKIRKVRFSKKDSIRWFGFEALGYADLTKRKISLNYKELDDNEITVVAIHEIAHILMKHDKLIETDNFYYYKIELEADTILYNILKKLGWKKYIKETKKVYLDDYRKCCKEKYGKLPRLARKKIKEITEIIWESGKIDEIN